VNLSHPKIHQREGPRLRARELGFEVHPEALVDRGDNFARADRSLGRHAADRVAAANDTPPLHAAAGEFDRPTLRPVVATGGRIYLGGAAELGQVANQRVLEQTALDEVF
jgi:hypothetical protein